MKPTFNRGKKPDCIVPSSQSSDLQTSNRAFKRGKLSESTGSTNLSNRAQFDFQDQLSKLIKKNVQLTHELTQLRSELEFNPWRIDFPDLKLGCCLGSGESSTVYQTSWKGAQVAV